MKRREFWVNMFFAKPVKLENGLTEIREAYNIKPNSSALWHVREVSPEYDALVEEMILELKGFVVRWEECDGRMSAGVYCDSSRFRDAEQLLSKLEAYRAKEKL